MWIQHLFASGLLERQSIFCGIVRTIASQRIAGFLNSQATPNAPF
jgi:hypothetical protein